MENSDELLSDSGFSDDLLETNDNDVKDDSKQDADGNKIMFKPGSLRGSTISMIGTILSAGTVTLPYAIREAGVIPGFVMLVIGWYISAYTSKLLVKCSIRSGDKNECFTQEALALQLGGENFNITMQILMFLTCLGQQVSYMVMASGLVVNIVHDVFGLPSSNFFAGDNVFRVYACIIQVAIVLPLSCLRRVKDFIAITMAQILIIIQVIIAIIICGFQQQGQQTTNDPSMQIILQDNYQNMDMDLNQRMTDMKLQSTSVVEYLNAFPFVVFAFAGQPWVLTVQEGMERRNIKRAQKFIQRGVTFVLIAYTLVSFFGQATFLKITESNILQNDQQDQWYAKVCSQIILLSILFNMPYNIFPMRNLLISQQSGIEIQDIDKASPMLIFITALICNVICLALSIITSRIQDVMTIVGNTLNVFVCFMIPCIYQYLMNKKMLGRETLDKKNIGPILVATLTGACGLASLTIFILGKFITIES